MVFLFCFVQFSLPGVRVSVQTNLCFEVRFVVCVCVEGGGGGLLLS